MRTAQILQLVTASLLLCVLYFNVTAQETEVGDAINTTYRILRPTGSSVLIPGLESVGEASNDYIYHELKKVGGGLLAVYHGNPKVFDQYANRGEFYTANKSFLLRNLSLEDSGVYEQKVNYTTLVTVILEVLDPVEDPRLTMEVIPKYNGSCRVRLQCSGRGGLPLDITFYRNGRKINGSAYTNSSARYLDVDGADPQSWDIYTCNVSNRVSWNMSRDLQVQPEGPQGDLVPLYISFTGLAIYIIHLICYLLKKWVGAKGNVQQKVSSSELLSGTLRQQTPVQATGVIHEDDPVSQDNDVWQIFRAHALYVIFLLGLLLEVATLAILSYYACYFQEQRHFLIFGLLMFSCILATRIFWVMIINDWWKPPVILHEIAEHVLFMADFICVLLIFTVEIISCYRRDVCGIFMQWKWMTFLYFPIFMVVLAVVVFVLQKHFRGHIDHTTKEVKLRNINLLQSSGEVHEGSARKTHVRTRIKSKDNRRSRH